MDEINITVFRHASEQRTLWFGQFQLVPPDLRNFESVACLEANHLPSKNSHPSRATVEFLAAFEQGLISDANPEKWPARADELTRRFEQRLFLHSMNAIVKCSDARQHDCSCIRHLARVLGDAYLCAHLEQRLMHAAQIAGTIIKQSNHANRLKGLPRRCNR